MTAPRFVDAHCVAVDAPRERVWTAVRAYCRDRLARDRGGLLTRALGTDPGSGFAVSAEVPGTRVELSGRHRFSRYRLVFELRDRPDGTTEVAARTFADFPGPHGLAYRALVIGTRGHALAVRNMLRSIDRASRT